MGPVTGPRGRAGVRGNTTARGAVCDTRHGLRPLHEPDGHPSVRRERAAVDDPTTFSPVPRKGRHTEDRSSPDRDAARRVR